MPVYGYKCEDCNYYFEKIQKMSDKPLIICEKCSGKLIKQFFPVGLIYKADGFYTTEHGHASKDFKKNTNNSTKTSKSSKNTKTEKNTKPENTSKSKNTKD